MSQPTTSKYPAEFKERAVKLAVESEQSMVGLTQKATLGGRQIKEKAVKSPA